MNLPKIDLVNAATAKTIVLAWFSLTSEEKGKEKAKEDKAKPAEVRFRYAGKKSKETDAIAEKLSQSKHFFAKKSECSFLRYFPFGKFENVLLAGIGPDTKVTSETLRQVGASLASIQKKERLDWIAINPEGLLDKAKPADRWYWLQALCEGYLLSGYEFTELKKKQEKGFEVGGLQIETTKVASLKEDVERAVVLAQSVCLARSLGDRPGNFLTPTMLAQKAEEAAKEAKLKFHAMGAAEIQKESMGLLWGVAKGSEEEPRFIVMEYRGGNKGDRPVVLVGKGITFDSGGISLKPPAKMEDMKYDMMGAAAVVGIMRSIGLLKPKLNVIGVIPSCENMPDGKAQKPGDVMKSRSGKTVEIVNTDAEGRLILADALEYVQDKMDPQAILDFATLTGAVIDALGTITSGIMGTHPGLIERVKAAAELTQERVWQLPLYDEYEEDLKSHVADIKNSGIREAGSSKGGTFLKFFVDKKYPWVHCDIAGTSYHRRDVNYHPQKYGAGVMVRLITHMLLDWKTIK